VGGFPAIDVALWRRAAAALLRLPELLRRVRRLEQARAQEGGHPAPTGPAEDDED
jgi:hypothetical protein